MTKLIRVFVAGMIDGLFPVPSSLPLKELKECARFLPPLGIVGIVQDFKFLEESIVTTVRTVQNEYTSEKKPSRKQPESVA